MYVDKRYEHRIDSFQSHILYSYLSFFIHIYNKYNIYHTYIIIITNTILNL